MESGKSEFTSLPSECGSAINSRLTLVNGWCARCELGADQMPGPALGPFLTTQLHHSKREEMAGVQDGHPR